MAHVTTCLSLFTQLSMQEREAAIAHSEQQLREARARLEDDQQWQLQQAREQRELSTLELRSRQQEVNDVRAAIAEANNAHKHAQNKLHHLNQQASAD